MTIYGGCEITTCGGGMSVSGTVSPCQTVANQMWSYATLRYHPGDELLDTFAAMVTKHVHHFKPQELSNVVGRWCALNSIKP